ncbi:hypothetical protein HOY80DRAFT_943047 [Tuber brumale]|nr:hypothetical protein HOY80DRAFT_943047 [Tuber brumale]
MASYLIVQYRSPWFWRFTWNMFICCCAGILHATSISPDSRTLVLCTVLWIPVFVFHCYRYLLYILAIWGYPKYLSG